MEVIAKIVRIKFSIKNVTTNKVGIPKIAIK